MTDLLYDRVVSITEEYLGPTAQRFIARQVTYHFHKSPHDLAVEDIPKLVEWTKLTLALLTDKRSIIEECGNRLMELAQDTPNVQSSNSTQAPQSA